MAGTLPDRLVLVKLLNSDKKLSTIGLTLSTILSSAICFRYFVNDFEFRIWNITNNII